MLHTTLTATVYIIFMLWREGGYNKPPVTALPEAWGE